MTTWQRVSVAVAGLVVVGVLVGLVVAPSLGGRTPGPLQVDLDGATSERSGPDDGDVGGEVGGDVGGDDPSDAPGDGPTASEDGSASLWLCGPAAEDDACLGDLDATVVAADGSRSLEPFAYAEDPPVDCFYVYPTVSGASGTTAPLEVTEAERSVAQAQAARFGAVCQVVAPVYRQVTVSGLLSSFRDPVQRAVGYEDVLAAFEEHVVAGDRPYVLLGHSQGAHVLTQLIAERIEDDPDLHARLVSALLLGGEVEVPWDADVGESFQATPACTSADQTGCVVAYNAFAEEPPAGALFGRSSTDRRILCVNPAALEGGPATLRPYLPTSGAEEPFDTPFATTDGGVTAECRTAGNASWLQVDVDPDREIRVSRAEPIGGAAIWGLHTGDVNLALGDLVDLVDAQIAAHLAERGAS